MTRGAFATEVMKRLGVERTVHTRRAFQTWMQSEGGSARNNPLNTTLPMPGATDYNWVHVKNYVSAEQGIEATVETFHTSGAGYGKILHALKTNAPARKTVALIGESSWGTGKTLMAQVLAGIAHLPGVLWALERKRIAT